ncbi:SLATT domain-containing protein [Acidovorax radicis]|uniref:SLATT domain-containing protein n=1 Tax=Acidovorax radicis TaxID=758826 RepID=UPI0009D92B0B|nr:SLATT domain-containing protein [Acidovorax radicis]
MQNFDDVWFTFKARVAAELRLKNNDVHSQILLVWYALVSSAASIVAVRYEKFAGPDTDIYTAILSVALLVISMLVANRDYRGRALQLRANHIALKKLHDDLKSGLVSVADKPAMYSKLLAECENHSSYDDRYFRVLNRAGLTTRIPTRSDYFFMLSVCSFRVVFLLVLYILPFTAFYIQSVKN